MYMYQDELIITDRCNYYTLKMHDTFYDGCFSLFRPRLMSLWPLLKVFQESANMLLDEALMLNYALDIIEWALYYHMQHIWYAGTHYDYSLQHWFQYWFYCYWCKVSCEKYPDTVLLPIIISAYIRWCISVQFIHRSRFRLFCSYLYLFPHLSRFLIVFLVICLH